MRAAPHRDEYVGPAHAPLARRGGSERNLVLLIAVIVVLVVVLPLVLAMILYIGIIGFDSPDVEPVTTDLIRFQEDGYYRFTFGAFSSKTTWDDITIVLSDGQSSVSWSPDSSALGGSPPSVLEFMPMEMGDMVVFCNVTDLAADEWVDSGDMFTISTGSSPTFSSVVVYTVLVIYERTGTPAASISFSP